MNPEVTEEKPSALVIGVGAYHTLGAACCRRFAAQGFHVIAAARLIDNAQNAADAIHKDGGSAEAVCLDSCDEKAVASLFTYAMTHGNGRAPVSAVVFHAGNSARIPFLELTAARFERMWKSVCYAGFLIGREAMQHMVTLGRGTVIFTGATGSLRGKDGYAHYAAAKGGLRMVVQSMAREFGPLGIHVSNVILDGAIEGQRLSEAEREHFANAGPASILQVDAVAETIWHLHTQHPSAWTHELDLRPSVETF
ncbi:glucose 1-dehydrogenase [Pseudomonas sp. RIT-PI-q]|nr:glucose 1-dehydrogenase [Pseudomonas sp. RIT-PI-q]